MPPVSRRPFFWIATHRDHHRHSDTERDPHSPSGAGGRWRGFWHAHLGWLHSRGFGYSPETVRDLTRRRDLAWIDRYWIVWYVAGLLVPALAGYLIGGTAYDALIGFLWGGLLRHFLVIQATFCVNSINHLWGTRPYDTGDDSRNNLFTGIIAFGGGHTTTTRFLPARQGCTGGSPTVVVGLVFDGAVGLVWVFAAPRRTVNS